MSPVFLFTASSVCCCWAWSRLRMSESNSDYRAWPWHLRVTLLFFTLALKPQLFFFFYRYASHHPMLASHVDPVSDPLRIWAHHFKCSHQASSGLNEMSSCGDMRSDLVSLLLNTSTTCQWRTFIESYSRDVVPEGLRERNIDILTLIAT